MWVSCEQTNTPYECVSCCFNETSSKGTAKKGKENVARNAGSRITMKLQDVKISWPVRQSVWHASCCWLSVLPDADRLLYDT